MTQTVSQPSSEPPDRRSRWIVPRWSDPRIPFAALLTAYAVLGVTVLRFNRSPLQIALTVASACLLDLLLHYLFRERRLLVPLSAYITGLSLALLLNYSHDHFLLFLPVYLAIGSKYVFTFEGRHVFNPSMFGVVASLLLGGQLLSAAPAYQWGGTWAASAFLVTAALALFVFRIGRTALILSFLGFYVVQIALRAWYMRWFLPPEALLLGTLTNPAFYLFVFYMITDPRTSPASRRDQVLLGFGLVAVDLLMHRVVGINTFFYALFVVQAGRLVFLHLRRAVGWLASKPRHARFEGGRRVLARWAVVGGLGIAMVAVYQGVIHPRVAVPDLRFALEPVPDTASGIRAVPSDEAIRLVDPRLRHLGKWLLSAGDAAAAGDFDGDGLLDLCLTHPLKRVEDRIALYRNLGDLRFERVAVPALDSIRRDPAAHGLASCALFADYDNDGDQDLVLPVGYGRTRLLRNRLAESGRAEFEDVTEAAGLVGHGTSIAANLLDFDRDGRLDLFVANSLNPWLDRYDPPRPLNVFDLPAPEHEGDRRMLPIMHASWDDAENGGRNALYRNLGAGRFQPLDVAALGMPETHWSLAIGTGDLDNDGWTDLYVANDFGPDDLYLNREGRGFEAVRGSLFGSVGRDTYKGMNVSLGDVDRNGWLDVHVSNVHVSLQAEGSLLWMTHPPKRPGEPPRFRDEATLRGALNERAFGWGGAFGDLDLDGWLDLVQMNGMIDDSLDPRFPDCRSYWYVNEKLMRAGPELHVYADMWGDLSGYCINGHDPNRVWLSRGPEARLQFVEVTEALGLRDFEPGRGALLADLDEDGDLDVLLTHQFAPPTLYRNTLDDGSWIGFRLVGDGVGCNRDAAGSRLFVEYGDPGGRETQMREIAITNAFAAQGDRRALFGLGGYDGPVRLRVSWCGNAPVDLGTFSPGRYHTIVQGAEERVVATVGAGS